jgi:hypothetical protein
MRQTAAIASVQLVAGRGRRNPEAVMLEDRAKVLLLLSQDIVNRARVFAGKATIALKLPISLQIVLRALIEEGLKREDHPALLANVEGQAKAVREKRILVRRAGVEEEPSRLRPGPSREPKSRGSQRRRK